MKDFDESGKLVTVPTPPKEATKPEGFRRPSWLANPLGFAPTGSPAGRANKTDVARAAMVGSSVFGVLTMALPLVQQGWAALAPVIGSSPLGARVVEVVNATVALTTALAALYQAYARESTHTTLPAPVPAPAPVPVPPSAPASRPVP